MATAVVAGGGVALAQANGSSNSQHKPVATKSKKQTTPRTNNAAPRDHDCPNGGSNSSDDTAFDL